MTTSTRQFLTCIESRLNENTCAQVGILITGLISSETAFAYGGGAEVLICAILGFIYFASLILPALARRLFAPLTKRDKLITFFFKEILTHFIISIAMIATLKFYPNNPELCFVSGSIMSIAIPLALVLLSDKFRQQSFMPKAVYVLTGFFYPAVIFLVVRFCNNLHQ